MKLIITAALLSLSLPLLAQTGQPMGPEHGYTPMTLSEAKSAADDSLVSIRGFIVKRLSDDEYLLKSANETLTVEIDDHLWQGIQITDKHEVEIKGEIDQDWDRTELEADKLNVLPQ